MEWSWDLDQDLRAGTPSSCQESLESSAKASGIPQTQSTQFSLKQILRTGFQSHRITCLANPQEVFSLQWLCQISLPQWSRQVPFIMNHTSKRTGCYWVFLFGWLKDFKSYFSCSKPYFAVECNIQQFRLAKIDWGHTGTRQAALRTEKDTLPRCGSTSRRPTTAVASRCPVTHRSCHRSLAIEVVSSCLVFSIKPGWRLIEVLLSLGPF